jgi:hypothetical protein
LGGCDDVKKQSPIKTSAFGLDVVRWVEYESRLIVSRNEPNESSHMPVRPKPRAPGGGFGKYEKGGGCEFGLCSGSALRGLGKVDAVTCDSGDLIVVSSRAVGRGFANIEDASGIGEGVESLPCESGRYRGLRIGHEMPACSSMSENVSHKQVNLGLLHTPLGAC